MHVVHRIDQAAGFDVVANLIVLLRLLLRRLLLLLLLLLRLLIHRRRLLLLMCWQIHIRIVTLNRSSRETVAYNTRQATAFADVLFGMNGIR